MTLEEYQDEYEKDCAIDRTDPELFADQMDSLPHLHQKYLKWFFAERKFFRQMEVKYNKVLKLRQKYWMNKLDQHQIQEMNWEPQPVLIKTLIEANQYIETDDVMVPIKSQMENQKIKMDYLEKAVTELSYRNSLFTNIIAWQRFQHPDR
jgi:hypothetical protein